MTKPHRLFVLPLLVLLALFVGFARRAAAEGVTFTVSVKSAYLRAQPSFAGERAYSVFQGQSYPVLGRTGDSAWLQLAFPGAANGATWIPIAYGLVEGNLGVVPVTAAASAAATAPPPQAAAGSQPAGRVIYTVVAKSFYARAVPSFSGAKVASLFAGQTYRVVARSDDNTWLRLSLGAGREGWAPAVNGTVTGQVAALPAGGAVPAPEPTTTPIPSPGGLPSVSQAARDIYQRGLEMGNNPRAFSKVGDCNSVTPFFLAAFDKGDYRLGGSYASLQQTIDHFAGSFGRESVAARDGINVTTMLDPTWANPKICQKGESPLACEYRLQRPSLAIISLGTNGAWQTNEEYERDLRRILDYSIEQGVLPILSTKADNLEGGDRFNQIVLKLAGEYGLPLWDFAQAARSLPNGGLADAYHLTYGPYTYDNTTPVRGGWPLRNLTALQAIDAVWKAVK